MAGPGEGISADHAASAAEALQLSHDLEPLKMEDLFRVVPLRFSPYEEAGHIQAHHVSQPPNPSEWPQIIDGDAAAVWVGSRYWFCPQEGFETVGEQDVLEELEEDEKNHRSQIMALVATGAGESPGRGTGSFSETMRGVRHSHLESVGNLIRKARAVREEADLCRELEWLDFEDGDEAFAAMDSLVELLERRKITDHQARLHAINEALTKDPSRMMIGVRMGSDLRFAELRQFELETREGIIMPVPIVTGPDGDKKGLLPKDGRTLGRVYFEVIPEVAAWVKGQAPEPGFQGAEKQAAA
jgi:hypothetical protein